MGAIQVFNFESRTVRTQIDSQGNPWWVAKDICEVLGISKYRDAAARLDDDESMPLSVDASESKMTCISESGLYSLILRSQKPEAKRFKKWITSEVIPSIRKTGSFSLGDKAAVYPVAEPVFRALASVAREFGLEGNQALLYANKATRRETGVDFQSVLQIELKNHEQARFFTPTELGKRIAISGIKFNKDLNELGLQEKRNGVWCATAKGKAYSMLLDAGKKHSDGTPIQQLKWSESVLELLNKQVA